MNLDHWKFRIHRKNGVTYIVRKHHGSIMLWEWPVFVIFFPRYVVHVYLNWWVLWHKGEGFTIVDWGYYIYGKYWRFLCFRITKTEKYNGNYKVTDMGGEGRPFILTRTDSQP